MDYENRSNRFRRCRGSTTSDKASINDGKYEGMGMASSSSKSQARSTSRQCAAIIANHTLQSYWQLLVTGFCFEIRASCDIRQDRTRWPVFYGVLSNCATQA
jgi:hypothetical protein